MVIDMYNSPAAASAAGTAGTVGGLAMTGLNVVWLLLAAFALLGAGMAVMRLVPRREG
jgi:hypothetical protein